MEVVYYLDEGLEICPVKKYLENLLPKSSERRVRLLAQIDQKIKFIRENPGKAASFIGTLHGHNFLEIKNRKDESVVIRILYSIYNGKIILLNAFEKSDKYDTNKIKKMVEKYYLLTDTYLVKFKKNPNSYETYK